MESVTIRITEAVEGGYFYDIWEKDVAAGNDEESDDGGFCTTTMLNALGMAMQQAETLIKNAN